MVEIAQRLGDRDVFTVEHRADLGGGELLAGRVGDPLDHLAELDLQTTRQRQPVVALQQVGDAALAGLAVDADDRVVGAAEVGRIDRQVRHVPERLAFRLQRGAFGEPFLIASWCEPENAVNTRSPA